MKNLAGNNDCDKEIERELMRCGVEIMRDQPREGRVPSSIRGKLGPFILRRGTYYWEVKGEIPYSVAKELYENPVGKTDIRVSGDLGCPPPWMQVRWKEKKEDGKTLVSKEYMAYLQIQFKKGILLSDLSKNCRAATPQEMNSGFVDYYHIDSELGLYIFIDILKKHKLV